MAMNIDPFIPVVALPAALALTSGSAEDLLSFASEFTEASEESEAERRSWNRWGSRVLTLWYNQVTCPLLPPAPQSPQGLDCVSQKPVTATVKKALVAKRLHGDFQAEVVRGGHPKPADAAVALLLHHLSTGKLKAALDGESEEMKEVRRLIKLRNRLRVSGAGFWVTNWLWAEFGGPANAG